ncbi:MAG: hypothetical protein WCJ57_04655, partial [Candidatus Falkowbacteria bacterium]
ISFMLFGQHVFSQGSITVSPSSVHAYGGNITIHGSNSGFVVTGDDLIRTVTVTLINNATQELVVIPEATISDFSNWDVVWLATGGNVGQWSVKTAYLKATNASSFADMTIEPGASATTFTVQQYESPTIPSITSLRTSSDVVVAGKSIYVNGTITNLPTSVTSLKVFATSSTNPIHTTQGAAPLTPNSTTWSVYLTMPTNITANETWNITKISLLGSSDTSIHNFCSNPVSTADSDCLRTSASYSVLPSLSFTVMPAPACGSAIDTVVTAAPTGTAACSVGVYVASTTPGTSPWTWQCSNGGATVPCVGKNYSTNMSSPFTLSQEAVAGSTYIAGQNTDYKITVTANSSDTGSYVFSNIKLQTSELGGTSLSEQTMIAVTTAGQKSWTATLPISLTTTARNWTVKISSFDYANTVAGSTPTTYTYPNGNNPSITINAPAGGVVPVAPACGSAVSQPMNTAPASNLCSPGNFSAPALDNATGNYWNWNCSNETGSKACSVMALPTLTVSAEYISGTATPSTNISYKVTILSDKASLISKVKIKAISDGVTSYPEATTSGSVNNSMGKTWIAYLPIPVNTTARNWIIKVYSFEYYNAGRGLATYMYASGSNPNTKITVAENILTVNPGCGAAVNNSYAEKPTTSLCNPGTPTVPGLNDVGDKWKWDCTSNTTTLSCSAPNVSTVVPVCGSGNNIYIDVAPTATVAFSHGDFSALTGASPGSWKCSAGGKAIECASKAYTAFIMPSLK